MNGSQGYMGRVLVDATPGQDVPRLVCDVDCDLSQANIQKDLRIDQPVWEFLIPSSN